MYCGSEILSILWPNSMLYHQLVDGVRTEFFLVKVCCYLNHLLNHLAMFMHLFRVGLVVTELPPSLEKVT